MLILSNVIYRMASVTEMGDKKVIKSGRQEACIDRVDEEQIQNLEDFPL